MKFFKARVKGFSLLEMLLVLAILSGVLMLLTNYTTQRMSQFRRDKAAIQMQQILNAGLAFFINQGYWPAQASATAACVSQGLTNLQGPSGIPQYLPSTVYSPWAGATYQINCNLTSGTFTVSLTVPGSGASGTANASSISGMVPMGTVSGSTVTGQVLVPGQNLNNARSVNFAGYYHNGACVPAPTCPTNMAPDILVVPISLYGVNDMSTTSAYYSLYGFTAYAYGQANGTTTPSQTPGAPTGSTAPADCYSPASAATCTGGGTAINSNYTYWRVCLSVTTEKGVVSITADSGWGQYATVMAITRCVPQNENSGSDFSVWTR